MLLADAINIISRVGGAFASRWLHVLAGITWIGLLYYFNFVQVPAFAQMEAAARNNALDKLTWRALWWFRWAAVVTLASGIGLLLFENDKGPNSNLFTSAYWKSNVGISIATGILLAVTMFLNVWLVIWPNQKKVIANARNVQAGGEADPAAVPAGRRAALASRQNTIFSFPMLMFMVGTAHFFGTKGFVVIPSSSNRAGYWIIAVVIWAVFELSALGVIGGRGQNFTNWPYESHKNAIITGLVLVVGYYFLYYGFLKV